MKCDKCGYVSFDYNLTCPGCKKDLTVTRNRLGIAFQPPETDFDEFFTGASGQYATSKTAAAGGGGGGGAELDMEGVEDDFEFTLDD